MREHEPIDSELRFLASLRWLFSEFGTGALCRQVDDSLRELVDELLDERLASRGLGQD